MDRCENKLVVGSSGSGKSHFIIEYINISNADVVIVVSKTAEQNPNI
jgi:Trk K+ transport system NAD-binding subunit